MEASPNQGGFEKREIKKGRVLFRWHSLLSGLMGPLVITALQQQERIHIRIFRRKA